MKFIRWCCKPRGRRIVALYLMALGLMLSVEHGQTWAGLLWYIAGFYAFSYLLIQLVKDTEIST